MALLRIRKKIFGTNKVPRMAIHKSNKNIYVQFVDDSKSITLLSGSTRELKLKNAANATACLGVRTFVETTVAIAFAES